MELMDSSLDSRLADLTPDTCLHIITEMAKGLEYLHSSVKDQGGDVVKARVLHRDLKSENVLVSHDFTSVKLSDFGLSRTITSTQLASTVSGTPLMMAPEVYEDDEKYGSPADVWSFGMLIFELLAGRMPYTWEIERGDLKPGRRRDQHIARGKLPSMEPIRNPDDPTVVRLVAIMQQCIQKQPEDRPTMSQIVQLLAPPAPAAAAAPVATAAAAAAPAASTVGSPAAAAAAAAPAGDIKRKPDDNVDEPSAKRPRNTK